MANPEIEGERGSDRRYQAHRQPKPALDQCHAEAGPHALVERTQVSSIFVNFLAERLHNPQCAENFLHDRQRLTVEVPGAASVAAKPGAIKAVSCVKEWRDDCCDE